MSDLKRFAAPRAGRPARPDATEGTAPAGMPAARRSPGFTLLEVMVALSVIAIALVAVYKLHSQTLLMSQEALFHARAPILAGAKEAELEALFPEAPTNDSGDFGEAYPGYGWRVEIDDVVSEVLGETADDVKRIDITVFLNDGEQSYRMRSYRFLR